MFSIEVAVLPTCAALSISSWLLNRPIRPLSLGWIMLFNFVHSKDVLRTTIAARKQWLGVVSTSSVLFYIAFQLYFSFRNKQPIRKTDLLENESAQGGHESGLKPLLLPARTTHTRLFPKKHSFSYSYLLVGIPVGWRGAVGSFLSADILPECIPGNFKSRKSWFNISAADYLDRGSEDSSLQGKLQSYLKSQREDITEYPYAYLVTAPRFLDYSFNPVSFWYLYNMQMELRAIIVEVNNTFDERRIYFLKGSVSTEKGQEGIPAATTAGKFKDSWIKDFHVSPFNSRKGSYALSAQDPFSTQSGNMGEIDNTITLSSSKAHAKLVARIFSTQPSIDPIALGYWGRLRFIASWWWVGFVTFPRIIKEAGRLFFRKKLHVWFRPEVLEESLGRRATKDEIIIERTFRSFLRSLVESSNLNYSIKYISPIPSSRAEETFMPNSSSHDPIVLRISTPLFYARLAHFPHTSEYLSHEILTADNKNRTFYISHPQPFIQLLDERSTNNIFTHTDPPPKHLSAEEGSFYDRLPWRFLCWLRNHRRRPSSSQQDHTQQQPDNQIDIRQSGGFSPFDHFAMRHESREQAVRYRNVVTRILLGDILAFGHPEVFDAVGYVLRVFFSYLFVVAVKFFWVWALGERERTVRTCYQAEDEAWCENETFYG